MEGRQLRQHHHYNPKHDGELKQLHRPRRLEDVVYQLQGMLSPIELGHIDRYILSLALISQFSLQARISNQCLSCNVCCVPGNTYYNVNPKNLAFNVVSKRHPK